MTPRPIHKWKTFWLGLLVIAFLGWSWAFSLRTFASIRWGLPVHDALLQIAVHHGTISIQEVRYTPPHNLIRGFYPSIFPAPPPADWFPRSWRFGHGNDHWSVELSLWLLILLFLIPWLALLTWRWRKARHLTAQPTAPP